MRPSGLKAAPFETRRPVNSVSTLRSVPSRWMAPTGSRGPMHMVPATSRPRRSTAPSFIRLFGLSASGSWMWLKVPASGSKKWKPSSSATMKPPASRGAKQPIRLGMVQARFCPVAGSKRLRVGASMSTHHTARSRSSHKTPSPILALQSSTQSTAVIRPVPLHPAAELRAAARPCHAAADDRHSGK